MEQNQTNFSQPPAASQPVSQLTAKMPGPLALLKESLNIYKTHFRYFISISLLYLVGISFSVLLVMIFSGLGRLIFPESAFPVLRWLISLGIVAIVGISLSLGYLLIYLALIGVLRFLRVGRSFSIIDSLKVALKMILPAVLITILYNLATIGAAIPLLAPGIIVGLLLTFSLFSLVIEDQHGLNALLRSRYLVKGNIWAVFWRMLIVGLIIALPIIFLSFFLAAFQLPEILVRIFDALLNILLLPLFVIYSYLIFQFLSQQKPLGTFNPQEKRRFYKGLTIWGSFTIVGFILISILLAALFSARLRAKDAAIISVLSQIRTEAEIYFYNSESYIGVDDFNRHPQMKVLVDDLVSKGGQIKWGMITPKSYVAWSPLVFKKNTFYCIDSTPAACELNREPEGGEKKAVICGCPKDEGKQDETANWQVYRNEELGIEFKYPKSWGKVTESRFQGPTECELGERIVSGTEIRLNFSKNSIVSPDITFYFNTPDYKKAICFVDREEIIPAIVTEKDLSCEPYPIGISKVFECNKISLADSPAISWYDAIDDVQTCGYYIDKHIKVISPSQNFPGVYIIASIPAAGYDTGCYENENHGPNITLEYFINMRLKQLKENQLPSEAQQFLFEFDNFIKSIKFIK